MIPLSAFQLAAASAAKDTMPVSEDTVVASLLPTQVSETDLCARTDSRAPRHLALVLDASPCPAPADCLTALRETINGCCESGVRWLSVLLPAAHNGHSATCCEVLKTVRQYVQSEAEALAFKGVRLAPYPCAGLNGHSNPAHWGMNVPEPARGFYRALSSASKLNVPVESLCVHLGLGCGGREELLEALRQLAGEAAAGRLGASEISAELLEGQLAMPPVDLLVRTGGSQQISEFLMWQAAYAELLFVDVPWERFRPEHLRAAFADYARRDRKFGALPTC